MRTQKYRTSLLAQIQRCAQCLYVKRQLVPRIATVWFFGILLTQSFVPAKAEERIICCGAERVFILKLPKTIWSQPEQVWSWSAEDSKQIPDAIKPTFASTDECKPYDDSILITSSSGGVALIRREDKACEFLTTAKNAHSACLLPNSMVAVASSFGGDQLLLYKLTQPDGEAAKPITTIPLHGAHGVVWDDQRECLWALGSDELLSVKVSAEAGKAQLEVQTRRELPTPGGHELSETMDNDVMVVSSNDHVYRFNETEGTFSPYAELADAPKIKSVSIHPKTGEVVYHQGAKTTWWSDRIRFLGERKSIQLEGERLYKIRWDVPVFRWENERER